MAVQGLLGKKIGTTQIFTEAGECIQVTAVEVGPCFVTQVKTEDKDGYNAVQLAYGEAKKVKAAQQGVMKDMGKFRYLREVGVTDPADVKVGDKLDVNLFQAGEVVDIIGISKGKGFAGGVKRYHFHGGPKTHGQSDRHRAVGAMGGSSNPGHVFKGKRLPGHMGDHQVTAKNIEISVADPSRNLILLKGAVPGGSNALVIIRKTAEGK